MIRGSKNKGDWSEFYVLVYLLGMRKLFTADESLNKIENLFFPIKRIIRKEEEDREIEFVLNSSSDVSVVLNKIIAKTMTSQDFKDEASLLLRDIPTGNSSFVLSHGEEFLNSIFLERLAAPSSEITDITMELHDSITGIDQIMGFSIKSYLGGAPTLLNASGATNFTYEVIGITDTQMEEINSIDTRTKIVDRIAAIKEFGGKLEFYKPVNNTFRGNLLMIDSKMEQILAEILLYSYANNEIDCRKVIDKLEDLNPMQYPRKGLYVYKFKKFLCAKALGLDPSREWAGVDTANGGYIVAKSNGEVVAYHLYNRDKFEQYLFDNTKFERASTSRHNYAYIFKENGKKYINLNMQIRFK